MGLAAAVAEGSRRTMAVAAVEVEVVGIVGRRESMRNRTPASTECRTPAWKMAY